jgi:phosphopantetheinyl transferase
MNKKISFNSFDHPVIPEKIFTGRADIPDADITTGKRASERKAGRALITSLCLNEFGDGVLKITGGENTKPEGELNGQPLYLSISHTDKGVFAVISLQFKLGLDVEKCSRKIQEGVSLRMQNPYEDKTLYESEQLIRLWTLKEAALKWRGSGLRFPMKKILLKKISNHLFKADFDDGMSVEICSFEHSGKWISIAYS